MSKFLYVIRDLIGNNNSNIANCIFYLNKKSNQPEDGSQLVPKHVVERSNVRNTGLFISPSGISELDCATTKTDTAERSISIGRESLQFFFLY